MRIEEKIVNISGYDLYANQIFISDNNSQDIMLVFLHDALGCVDSWKDFPVKLCKLLGLNGLVYDRPGHGKSSPFLENRSIDYLELEATLILPQVLKAFDISEVILVGHSDGGTIGFLYATSGVNVKALIAISAHVMVEKITKKGVANAAPALLEKEQLDKLRNYHGNKALKLVEDWHSVWFSDDFASWNISVKLKEIACPSLIIQGVDDEYATKEHALVIKEGIGQSAQLLMIESCCHFPHKEHPQIVLDAIHSLLKTV